ncbi:hypothetical protein FACS1894166_08140 [Bacilli bacterium]|nr:hypothetical protein FACS1894166_08140 [Bacilli bacterium]
MPTQRKKKSETQFSDVGTFTKRKDGMTTLHSTKGNKTTVVAPSRM